MGRAHVAEQTSSRHPHAEGCATLAVDGVSMKPLLPILSLVCVACGDPSSKAPSTDEAPTTAPGNSAGDFEGHPRTSNLACGDTDRSWSDLRIELSSSGPPEDREKALSGQKTAEMDDREKALSGQKTAEMARQLGVAPTAWKRYRETPDMHGLHADA